jgi:hypothetical protein
MRLTTLYRCTRARAVSLHHTYPPYAAHTERKNITVPDAAAAAERRTSLAAKLSLKVLESCAARGVARARCQLATDTADLRQHSILPGQRGVVTAVTERGRGPTGGVAAIATVSVVVDGRGFDVDVSSTRTTAPRTCATSCHSSRAMRSPCTLCSR